MNAVIDLTRQERTVLALVARGARNAEIARELYLSIHTVESHLHRIFKKLQVSSRTQAALYARQTGLLSKQNSMETRKTGSTATTTIRS